MQFYSFAGVREVMAQIARTALPAVVLLIASFAVAAFAGCGPTHVAEATAAGPASNTKSDPLAEVLKLADSGDTDKAIQKFVSDAPESWVNSTSLPELRMTEAEFAKLDRAEKSRMQQKIIDRVAGIKGFARTVVSRASDAKKKGDAETAQKYVKAVNRLGEQLRDADVVKALQQTGNALSKVTIEE